MLGDQELIAGAHHLVHANPDALALLDAAPVEDLTFAQIDHHRALRQGYPEVVFGEGKTPEQALQICERLAARYGEKASCENGPLEGGGYRVSISMPLVTNGR